MGLYWDAWVRYKNHLLLGELWALQETGTHSKPPKIKKSTRLLSKISYEGLRVSRCFGPHTLFCFREDFEGSVGNLLYIISKVPPLRNGVKDVNVSIFHSRFYVLILFLIQSIKHIVQSMI